MSCGNPRFWLVIFGEVKAFSFLPWFNCLNQTSLDVVERLKGEFIAFFDDGLDFHSTFIGEIEAFKKTKRWLPCLHDLGRLIRASFLWKIE